LWSFTEDWAEMGTDNLDIFKKIIFSIPELKKIMAIIIGLGSVYATVTYLTFSGFADQALNWIVIPFLAFFVYIAPAVASGEVLYHVLPDYPRNWGYFLAMCNQALLFIYSLVMAGSESIVTTWNIIWLGLITVYLSNFFVLLLSVGYENLRKIGLTSLVQPLMILAAFHLFLGRYLQIPLTLYLLNFGFLLIMGLLLVIAFVIFDYLIGSNVSNVSVIQLASGLLQKRQEALDLGFPSNPDVQTFSIENQDSGLTFSVPWIHPGPLEGFGGGKITTHIIDGINDSEKGFFLHVPSTHQSDPADPRDTEKIVGAMNEPEKTAKASKMVMKEFDNAKFYGRTFGEQKIVFIDVKGFDDYEMAVFKEIIDLEDTTIVDLHNHNPDEGERAIMYYDTSMAEKMRRRMKEFIEALEELEQHEYSAGFELEMGDPSILALVEEVEDQKTLLYGVEGNGSSQNLRDLREEFRETYDEVLLFSTDTHSSIHEMATKEQIEKSRVRKAVELAASKISKASIGLAHGEAEKMKLLRQDYASLIFSINILVRLIPLTLALFYITLVVWVM
jgi:putative membrane protein